MHLYMLLCEPKIRNKYLVSCILFIALKGLSFIVFFHYSWCQCRVSAVKCLIVLQDNVVFSVHLRSLCPFMNFEYTIATDES